MDKRKQPHTEEHKRKISEAHKSFGENHWAKKPEVKLKMRLSHIGKPSGNKGKKASEETRLKMRLSHLGQINTPEQRKKQSVLMKLEYKKGRRNYFAEQMGSKHHAWKGGVSKQRGYHTPYKIAHKARKLMAEGNFTPQEWQAIKEKYNLMCLCCKQKEPFIKLTVDHIVPLSRGGSNWISNIQPLCFSCNGRKFTKIINFTILRTNANSDDFITNNSIKI